MLFCPENTFETKKYTFFVLRELLEQKSILFSFPTFRWCQKVYFFGSAIGFGTKKHTFFLPDASRDEKVNFLRG